MRILAWDIPRSQRCQQCGPKGLWWFIVRNGSKKTVTQFMIKCIKRLYLFVSTNGLAPSYAIKSAGITMTKARVIEEANPLEYVFFALTHRYDASVKAEWPWRYSQGQGSSHATHPLMLLIMCTKYGKNPSYSVDATGRTRKVNRQTDGQTDRQGESNIPP